MPHTTVIDVKGARAFATATSGQPVADGMTGHGWRCKNDRSLRRSKPAQRSIRCRRPTRPLARCIYPLGGCSPRLALRPVCGAGASTSSGVPSAQTCIWEWKRRIFLTNNPGLEDQFAELSLDGIRRKIQRWLDARGTYPAENAPGEYGFYINECFPIPDDRRAFFAEQVRDAVPHIGYRLLCHLAEADLVRSVWSPNFDGLPARAAANFKLSAIEIGIDTQNRAGRAPKKGRIAVRLYAWRLSLRPTQRTRQTSCSSRKPRCARR